MPLRPILAQLRRTDTALIGKDKNQPVIVFRHGRWQMLGIGFLCGPKMGAHRGIQSVNFMSPERARQAVGDWLPYSRLAPFEAVCPAFREELNAKVLPAAEDYGALLRGGWVQVVGGYTTDTLVVYPAPDGDASMLIARIAAMMRSGAMGPFLNFTRTYKAFQ